MLNIHKEAAENGTILLKLEGDATIESAERLHQALLEGLKEAEQLLLDCEQTSSFDLYALQLLGSAWRTSAAWNKTLQFRGDLPVAFEEAKQTLGFSRQHACSVCPASLGCLWTDQTSPTLD